MQLLTPRADYHQHSFILPLMEPYYYTEDQCVDDLARYGLSMTECLLAAISEAGQLDELAVYDALYAAGMAHIHGDDYDPGHYVEEYGVKQTPTDLDAFLHRNLTLVWVHYSRYIDIITHTQYGTLAFVDDVRMLDNCIGFTAFYHR